MNILEQHETLLGEKITSMLKGSEAGLATIFGNQWETIGPPGQRKEFGRLFKAAVKEDKYPDIQWVRIENSGRHDVYRKL